MAYERALRILALFTTALATPLLIACTVISLRPRRYYDWHRGGVTAWCFGYIPLALTTVASAFALAFNRRHERMPSFKFSLLDLFACIWYLSVLLPIWIVEIGDLHTSGFGLLAGYTTAPMIINMALHAYIFLCNVKSLWSWIFSTAEHECPNCHSKFSLCDALQVQQVNRGERYSLLRGEDYLEQDAVAYTEARDSGEQVGIEGETDIEDQDKGAIKI